MTTEIEVGDLARASGDSFKFENIGDKIAGTITQVLPPSERVNKFNDKTEMVYPIGITPDGETDQLMIWPVKTQNGATPMLQAIVQAVLDCGAKSYAVGGRLVVAHNATKDTGRVNPLKLFVAKYTPPAPAAGTVDLDDLLA